MVRGYANARRIRVTEHAYTRMRQRGVQYADLRSALTFATACVADDSRWKVTGPDEDGDDLACVVAIEAGLVVVTVF
jgi:pentatricopeptide repeat protein